MDNFQKQISTYILSATGNGDFLMQDKTMKKIYKVISAAGDYVSKYGAGIEAADISATSATYHLDAEFEQFNTQVEIGQGDASSYIPVKLDQRTHYWGNEVREAKKGLSAIEVARGWQKVISQRLSRAINQDRKIWNRIFFKRMFAKVEAFATGQTMGSDNYRVVFIPKDLTSADNIRIAWNQLSALRKIIRLHKDDTQAIDNMDAEMIVGDIDEYLARQFNQLGFNSSSPDKYIAGTQVKTIATWNNLNINPYINENQITGDFDGTGSKSYDVAVCLGTTITAKFKFKVLEANAGKIGNLSSAIGYKYSSVMGADKAGANITEYSPSELLKNTMWIVAYKDGFVDADKLLPTSIKAGGAALPVLPAPAAANVVVKN